MSGTIYFPGLNGLRAIASLAVVVCHVSMNLWQLDPNGTQASSMLVNGAPFGSFLAGYGVTIFFVLSGFLITYLLLEEKRRGQVHIAKFYIRRVLRIWPLYYLYIAVALIVAAIYGFAISKEVLLLYVFYAANLPSALGNELPFLYHYWSLGVEEQFYLFWPVINKYVKKLTIPLLLSIAFLIFFKLSVHIRYKDSAIDKFLQLTRFQCMLIGGLGAILFRAGNSLFMKIAGHKITQAISWAVLLLSALNRFHIATIIDNEIVAIVALCLIIGQITIRNRLINLDTNIFDFLGKISYGIYVIHPLVLFFSLRILAKSDMPYKFITVYVLVILATLLLAGISYHYFERYFLRYKKHFAVVQSAGTKREIQTEAE